MIDLDFPAAHQQLSGLIKKSKAVLLLAVKAHLKSVFNLHPLDMGCILEFTVEILINGDGYRTTGLCAQVLKAIGTHDRRNRNELSHLCKI